MPARMDPYLIAAIGSRNRTRRPAGWRLAVYPIPDLAPRATSCPAGGLGARTLTHFPLPVPKKNKIKKNENLEAGAARGGLDGNPMGQVRGAVDGIPAIEAADAGGISQQVRNYSKAGTAD